MFEGVNSGDWCALPEPIILDSGDPGGAVEIMARRFEVDPFMSVENGRALLGPETLRMERSDLLLYKGSNVDRASCPCSMAMAHSTPCA